MASHGFGGHKAAEPSQVPDEQDPDEVVDPDGLLESAGSEEEPEGSSSSEPAEHKRARERYDTWMDKEEKKQSDMFVDLGQFFGSIPPEQQISICRAYGSYLAAVQRARLPKKPRTYVKSGLFKKR